MAMNETTETNETAKEDEPKLPHERVIARADVQDRILRWYDARTFEIVRGWAGNPTGKIIGEGTRTPAPRGHRLVTLLRGGWIKPADAPGNRSNKGRTKRKG